MRQNEMSKLVLPANVIVNFLFSVCRRCERKETSTAGKIEIVFLSMRNRASIAEIKLMKTR